MKMIKQLILRKEKTQCRVKRNIIYLVLLLMSIRAVALVVSYALARPVQKIYPVYR